jgi:hypothetical protein
MEKYRMSKINLSHLKHKEVPTKEIEIEIDGKIQSVTIKPVNGRGLTSLGLISDSDVDKNSKMCLIALIYGLGITQDEAELFMNNETLAADTLASEILRFTSDYTSEISLAKEQVKKNSKTKTTK